MKNILLVFCFMSSFAFADLPKVADVESHMVSNPELAKTELKTVLDAKPDSPQANCYIAQLDKSNRHAQEVCDSFNQKLSDKKSDEMVSFVLRAIVNILIIGTAGILTYKCVCIFRSVQQKRKEQNQENAINKSKDKERRHLLSEVMDAKARVENAQLMLKAKGKELHPIYQTLKVKSEKAIDAIEILSEDGDYNAELIGVFLDDVEYDLDNVGSIV